MRGPAWFLVIAAVVPGGICGCAGVREGPASHVLVVGDDEGPRWISLVDGREGPWRTTAEDVRAHGVLSRIEAWWPAPDGSSVVVTGTHVNDAGRNESRLALVRLDGADEVPVLFGPPVNAQATTVGWAPDSSGFAVVARDESQAFACTVFSAELDAFGIFALPEVGESSAARASPSAPFPRYRYEQGVAAMLSPGAQRVAFAAGGNLYVHDVDGGGYLDVPESLERRNVIRVVGWLSDGRLATYCVGTTRSDRDLVFITIPTWQEERAPVSRDLGGVMTVHPNGSPFLTLDRDEFLLLPSNTWTLVWPSGESDSIGGERFRGWGWVPAASNHATPRER